MGSWGHWLVRSTTTRFVLLAFLLQLPITGGVLFFAQHRSEQALVAAQQGWVEELRRELLIAHQETGPAGLARAIDERIRSVRGDLAVILLADANGRRIAGNLSAWPPVLPDQTPWRTTDLYRVGSNRSEHIGASTMLMPDGTQLLTGRVIDADSHLTSINREALIAALIMGLLLTMLSAILLARIVSRQIDRIVRTAGAISEGALQDRVPIDGSGDAFDALGVAINTMLDRIGSLVSELRLTTDGLAHDLRSPVTRLTSVLERAMLETSDPQASAALEKVALEAETLLGMLTTALLISRTEAGLGREAMVEISLDTLLRDLVEVYGPLAEDGGFMLEAEAAPGVGARLNRELVSQAISNLIENALKYAEGGTRITLSAIAVDGVLQLAVADNGPGIAEARRGEAMRRFGRLDPARQASGSGLGLSLVEAVARLHGGTIALEDNGPGLRVVITLPG